MCGWGYRLFFYFFKKSLCLSVCVCVSVSAWVCASTELRRAALGHVIGLPPLCRARGGGGAMRAPQAVSAAGFLKKLFESIMLGIGVYCFLRLSDWPSGLRRQIQALFPERERGFESHM